MKKDEPYFQKEFLKFYKNHPFFCGSFMSRELPQFYSFESPGRVKNEYMPYSITDFIEIDSNGHFHLWEAKMIHSDELLKGKAIGQLLFYDFLFHTYPEKKLKELLIMNETIIQEVQKQRRGRLFVQEVLESYERQCAICGQSIRLGDALIGIDACHVKPIQHFGDDHVTNGIALCKIHHWALDRGAISISEERSILISPKLNGSRINEYFYEFADKSIFIPRNNALHLNEDNVSYHRRYVFEGGR
jgi:predicted restriction endonuclease